MLGAGLIGLVGGRLRPSKFFVLTGHGKAASDEPGSSGHEPPSWRRTLRIAAVCLVLWWTPVLAAGLALGWDSTLVWEGVFFSKAALVTFGGAYAVLPYVAQQAVAFQ